MAKRRLTQQQKARIQAIQEKRRTRREAQAEYLAENASAHLKSGRIICRHGATALVRSDTGVLLACHMRQNLGDVVCGDYAAWQRVGESEGVISAVNERTSLLSRPDFSGRDKPIAANISKIFLVIAPEPSPSSLLIDQYLVAAERIGVELTLVLNKIDLLPHGNRIELMQTYESLGYKVLGTSAADSIKLDNLREALKDNTSILVGQSGVGKSSLINKLLPDLELQTGVLNKAGHGKHTTSTTTCYDLPEGGQLIDSPGVREFRLGNITQQELTQGFVEIRDHASQCHFANCSHDHEPDCAVKQAVEGNKISHQRLKNFLLLLQRAEESRS